MFFMVLDSFVTNYTGSPPPAFYESPKTGISDLNKRFILLLYYNAKVLLFSELCKYFANYFR